MLAARIFRQGKLLSVTYCCFRTIPKFRNLKQQSFVMFLEPAGRGPAALGGISGHFGRLARWELAPLRASLPLLLGSAGYPSHVRISVTEKDKRASTDTHDVLRPKFRTGAGAHSPSSSGPSKSCLKVSGRRKPTWQKTWPQGGTHWSH